MGSLIKSPGGTIVSGGGYVAGRRELVEATGARLTAPGIGLDAGCVDGQTQRLMFQGHSFLSNDASSATQIQLALPERPVAAEVVACTSC